MLLPLGPLKHFLRLFWVMLACHSSSKHTHAYKNVSDNSENSVSHLCNTFPSHFVACQALLYTCLWHWVLAKIQANKMIQKRHGEMPWIHRPRERSGFWESKQSDTFCSIRLARMKSFLLGEFRRWFLFSIYFSSCSIFKPVNKTHLLGTWHSWFRKSRLAKQKQDPQPWLSSPTLWPNSIKEPCYYSNWPPELTNCPSARCKKNTRTHLGLGLCCQVHSHHNEWWLVDRTPPNFF